MKNPTPIVTEQKCSLCGLDWNRHGDKPTAATCIALLRADLDARQVVVPAPYPVVIRERSPWAPTPTLPYITYSNSTSMRDASTSAAIAYN